MLNAYSTNQTVAAADLVPFTGVSLIKGQTAVLSGSGTIQLNKAGVYMVHAIFTAQPGAAGVAEITMNKDGVAQPQAVATDPAVLTTVGVTLPIVTLVQVPTNNTACCCTAPTVLTFKNTGVALTKVNAAVVVTRIC